MIVNQLPLEGVTVAMENEDEKPELSIPFRQYQRTIFEKQRHTISLALTRLHFEAADPENKMLGGLTPQTTPQLEVLSKLPLTVVPNKH